MVEIEAEIEDKVEKVVGVDVKTEEELELEEEKLALSEFEPQNW